ncbi:MAG TPA: PilW family protein [Pseudomonas sp.]|uniref:PilW family protein n=1 Tax=Pseudomonas sp. TaxID=306 RepID=UPI002ED8D7AD
MNSALKHPRTTCSQHGLSLIELMVAMTIGCFLILGVTQIFINNQKSYLFQQSQVGNQENGRFALAVLGQELSRAGYRSKPTTFFAASSGLGCDFPKGTSVYALSSTALCIQYQAANRSDLTCQGAALSNADQTTIAIPYNQNNPIVIEKIALDTATHSITCTVGSNTQQLVTGVLDLRFDYGAGTEEKTVSSFSSAPTGVIGAVRYTALMQSGTSSMLDTTATSSVLTDWNNRYTTKYEDTSKIYQIVQSTVMLRNQMP